MLLFHELLQVIYMSNTISTLTVFLEFNMH